MIWAPLLSILSLCTVSMTQAGLTQPTSVSTGLGQTATITCTGNNNNVGNQGAGWVQQHGNQAPKAVMKRNNNRPSGVSERFSGSRSGNVATLSISGLQPEDEANYYCAAWDSSLSACTVVEAHGEVRQKPLSFLLPAHYPEHLLQWTCEDTSVGFLVDNLKACQLKGLCYVDTINQTH